MASSQELGLSRGQVLASFEDGLATIAAFGDAVDSPSVRDFASCIQVSSRIKPKSGWKSQDRAAISFLDKSISVEDLERAFHKAAEGTSHLTGGCSCTSMVILPEQILVAWLGDSPAFLVGVTPENGRLEEVIGLNEPHIPVYDKTALLAKGGIINEDGRLDQQTSLADQQNCYSLSMSRAFGNQWLGNLLIRKPDAVSFDRKRLSDKLTWYAVVGSDGILPESERNLMFPRKKDATFADNDLIHYCAGLFKDLVNGHCAPWLPENGNWSDNITLVAQQRLKAMEDAADKSQVGYAAMDDTTLLIVPLTRDAVCPSIVLTVADGHREAGEITAFEAVNTIQSCLAG